MTTLVERRPVGFALGTLGFIVALTVGMRLLLEALVPSLTLHGIGLVTNWTYVVLSVALVAYLGWWEKIRLTAPLNRKAVPYLLVLFVYPLVHVVFGLATPDVTLVEGVTLSGWAAVVVIVAGVSVAAAVSEELLYRGVLLRALEPRGRLFAAGLTALLFGATHVSQVILGGTTIEGWLLSALLMLPLGIGLAAVAFRLESLWPLILWHFASDSVGLQNASTDPLYALALIGMILVIGALGVWLLWQDSRTAADPVVAPPAPVPEPESP